MNRAALATGVGLCALVACSKEATVRFFDSPAGTAGTTASGDAGPPAPCYKLGPEVCNGGDDDCNGMIDEGCAATIAWTREPSAVIFGNPSGGVTFLSPCPNGSLLYGLRVGMGQQLNQVGAMCRQFFFEPPDGGGGPLISLGRKLDRDYVPALSSDSMNVITALTCPEGLVVAGADCTTSDDKRFIRGLRLSCAPAVVTSSSRGQVVALEHSLEQTVGPIVCSGCDATQAYTQAQAANAGQVITGLSGGAGVWLDGLSFDVSIGVVRPR